LPLALVILVILFVAQQRGTARIGRLLGPIMTIWFAVLALLGLWGIAQYPAVFWAINPALGLHYLFAGGANLMLVLGGVLLCVTGAEALYADLGHFGRAQIRRGWCVVFPALVLMRDRRQSCWPASQPKEAFSSAFAPRRYYLCHWSYWPLSPPPLPAKPSSRAPFR
jgi:K+ transporter